MQYLLINEDGSPEQLNREPTQEELEEMEGGTLAIYRLKGTRFEGADLNTEEDEDSETKYSLDWFDVQDRP
jgi:hypothetical protein